MTDFFYYSVAKRPEAMTEDELVQEIQAAERAASNAHSSSQGISSKETVRRRNCELALVKLPNGIDRWNTEFGDGPAFHSLELPKRRNKPWIDNVMESEEPPEVDIAQLTQITQKAINRGEEDAANKLAKLQAAEERKQRSHQILAAKILAEVPDKCYKEAERERTHAIIMSLKYDRDYEGVYSGTLPQEKLIGPGRIVYDYVVKMGLNPTIEYWWSGDGMESGHNLVAHWPKGDRSE